MSDPDPADRWQSEQTTFQRVYDVVLGTAEFATTTAIAERAQCSETGARDALEQLVEMGIAERRSGRPAAYRRNDAYLTWKRIEELARDHDPEELRQRVEELVSEDEAFRDHFGVPEPDAVALEDLDVDEQDAVEERWADLAEWRTVRRDVRVLRRAVQRAESRLGDGARA